jgi:hypothetical protein
MILGLVCIVKKNLEFSQNSQFGKQFVGIKIYKRIVKLK